MGVVENGAKTKKDTTSGSVENATKKSQEDKKKKATNEEEDASKENSKNGANIKSGSGSAAAAGGPLPLDSEGLPPLRKTAVNPAFKRKKETEEPSSNNKVLKTEDLKGKENDEKEKSVEVSARKEPKKNEEKSKLEKEPKHKVEASSKEGEDELMEVDSPVKSSKKKKKRV